MAKRRIIIREMDMDKLPKRFIQSYERVSFTPLTRDYFERRSTYFALKGKQYLADQYAHFEYPANMLGRLTSFKLHNRQYSEWLVKYNEVGEMVIRSGIRQPESRMGFITCVEKTNGN